MRLKIVRLLTALMAASVLAVCGGNDPVRGPGGNQRPQRASGGFPGAGGDVPETVSVKASRVLRRPISTYILSNTTLESVRKVTVFAKVNALVQDILVEEGDLVRNGQAFARLDDREIRNDFSQAQIALQQARLTLQQAQVKAELSQASFERSKSLFEQNLISKQEFDQAALANQTDTLGLQVAREQKDAAEARLEAAQIQLDYTVISSPLDGVVTERLIEVGSRVQPSQAVFTVEDFNPLWARIFVPERELPRLTRGQAAKLRFQAYPNDEFQGRILMINPTVDAASGTVKATLEVASSGGKLRPGMFGTAYIATETRPNATVIPKRAVLRERDDNRVFVIGAEGAVEKRDVTLGFSEDDYVEVVSGLQPGEAVVTVGQEGLSEGYSVKVLAWEGEPASAAPTAVAQAPPANRPAAADGPPSRPAGPPTVAQAGNFARGPGGGPPDPERLKMFLQRALQNPEIRKAYEERLAQDPKLADDPAKLRDFLREMRERFPGRNRQ